MKRILDFLWVHFGYVAAFLALIATIMIFSAWAMEKRCHDTGAVAVLVILYLVAVFLYITLWILTDTMPIFAPMCLKQCKNKTGNSS